MTARSFGSTTSASTETRSRTDYAPGLLDIGLVDGNIYALMVKVNSKAAIWYDPTRFATMGVAPAETWEDLVTLSSDIAATGVAPWALGAGDSWTLTDWFEITYLKMHGPDAYDTLFSPEGDWTDSTVTETINTLFGELLTADNVDGGIDGSLATLFVAAIGKVFSTSPTAELYCCGGFVGGIATGEEVNPALAGQEGPDGVDRVLRLPDRRAAPARARSPTAAT